MKGDRENSSVRVLRIIARLNIGGPAVHTVLLTEGMEAQGYHTLLVTGRVQSHEGDMAYLAQSRCVKPIIINELGRARFPTDDIVALVKILRLIAWFKPHVVHTHTAKAGTLGRLAALIHNKVQNIGSKTQGDDKENRQAPIEVYHRPCRVVHTFHGHVLSGYFSRYVSCLVRWVERLLASFTDTIVVVSAQQKDEICNRYGVGSSEQFRIVPLGLDLSKVSRCAEHVGEYRKANGIPENVPLVGIVGRLTAIKNHQLFLNAVRRLLHADAQRKVHFVVVGDGELRGRLEVFCKQVGISAHVTFSGWQRDLVPLYADLDILALTSDNEGTPVAVIEAMAAAVPVIATDVGGVRDLLSGSKRLKSPGFAYGSYEVCERGILVRPGDVKGFCRGLSYLLDQGESGRAMGLRARDYALGHHCAERLVSDMDGLYRSVLGLPER